MYELETFLSDINPNNNAQQIEQIKAYLVKNEDARVNITKLYDGLMGLLEDEFFTNEKNVEIVRKAASFCHDITSDANKIESLCREAIDNKTEYGKLNKKGTTRRQNYPMNSYIIRAKDEVPKTYEKKIKDSIEKIIACMSEEKVEISGTCDKTNLRAKIEDQIKNAENEIKVCLDASKNFDDKSSTFGIYKAMQETGKDKQERMAILALLSDFILPDKQNGYLVDDVHVNKIIATFEGLNKRYDALDRSGELIKAR